MFILLQIIPYNLFYWIVEIITGINMNRFVYPFSGKRKVVIRQDGNMQTASKFAGYHEAKKERKKKRGTQVLSF